jgi:hypothetical protein
MQKEYELRRLEQDAGDEIRNQVKPLPAPAA